MVFLGVPHLGEDYSTWRDILTRTLPFLAVWRWRCF